MLSSSPETVQRWLNYLPEKAILHRGRHVLNCNEAAQQALADPAIRQALSRCVGTKRELVVGHDKVPWCLSTSAMAPDNTQLTLLFPAAHHELQDLVGRLPVALVVHRWFKPLYTNQAFADLFQFESTDDVLALPSLRAVIGEEHWPMAQQNYQTLMDAGKLDTIQIEDHQSVTGERLQAQLVDFVLSWDGEPAVCTLVSNVSRQQAKIERYKRLALTDSLTGLGNRRRFFESSSTFIQRASSQGETLMLLVLDVDHFKAINDRYGHPVGDGVLKHLANCLIDCVDSEALVARIGGEEFALLMPAPSMSLLQNRAQEIKEQLCEQPYISDMGERIAIKVSIGATRWSSGDDSLEQMYQRADQALYQAKQSGRDRAVCQL
ncbi:GGDEF domain-containing protein [Ferrimonas pelagia]|uniref:diguanylate cyclase n=1 Tax=Ferrimonas pelagia TaxID=1177826 RepID=A0ABP9FB76_9GAMM